MGSYIRYFPVYAFGDLEGKSILLVGLNPAQREYEDNPPHLSGSNEIQERASRQRHYFDEPNAPYRYFANLETMFNVPKLQRLIGWQNSVWEKVGCLDLVKCVTSKERKQWTSLSPIEKHTIIGNCENYLIQQLKICSPNLIIAHGQDTYEWFISNSSKCEEKGDYLQIEMNSVAENYSTRLLLLPQRYNLTYEDKRKLIINALKTPSSVHSYLRHPDQ